MEAVADHGRSLIPGRRQHLDIDNGGRPRTLMAGFDQGLHRYRRTHEEPLDAAVTTIAHPTLDTQVDGRGYSPAPVPNALNASEDVYANCSMTGLVHPCGTAQPAKRAMK